MLYVWGMKKTAEKEERGFYFYQKKGCQFKVEKTFATGFLILSSFWKKKKFREKKLHNLSKSQDRAEIQIQVCVKAVWL